MTIKQYLDSLNVTMSLKLTNKCPLGCGWTEPVTKELLSTYPRYTHTHGRVYTLMFNRPSKKMVSTFYITTYEQEYNHPFFTVVRDIGETTEKIADSLNAGILKDYRTIPSFRAIWYGSSDKRYDFLKFLSKYRWYSISDVQKAFDIFDPNMILRKVSFTVANNFSDYCAMSDWDTHTNLMFSYDRAIKEARKFRNFFSETELKNLTNLRQSE